MPLGRRSEDTAANRGKEVSHRFDVLAASWQIGSEPFHLMRGVSESLAGRVGVVRLLG
jgi:hypothetical protein